MINFRFLKIAMIFCIGLFFLHPPFSAGQDGSPTQVAENIDESEPVEPLKITLSVNEVRLDVVVLDKNGNPLTDLTAGDFEVFQNGSRQNIVSSVYIDSQSGVAAAAKPAAAKKNALYLPPLPAPAADLKREDVRRTIILVVDDISMSFENGHQARMALRNFVEKQMQPGDMVAILKTSHGNSALQMFLSDKREALVRLDAMRLEMALTPNDIGSHLHRVYDNQLSVLTYSLRALKDMPGRKILIMMTAVPSLRRPGEGFMEGNRRVVGAPTGQLDFHALYAGQFSRLADDAMRAGVVVNFLDIGGARAFDNKNAESGGVFQREESRAIEREILELLASDPDMTEENVREYYAANMTPTVLRQMEIRYPQLYENERNVSRLNILNPLPGKTGGILIEDSNFFLSGVGRETESLMKGYYLVSYIPPSDTFKSGDKEIYNQLKVNVLRNNVRVHTRDGFYNRLGIEPDGASEENPLQDAIFSPFLNTDINVNMTAGYVKDARSGYLVRSWIHVDPKDITIVETEAGGARIDLEMMCLTSDINGFVQDSRRGQLSISNVDSPENIALLRRHGLRFVMLLPVTNPGSYYVRTAVRDAESGKIGSAYQYVEIPDLDKRQMALSSVFMAAGEEEFDWMRSDTARDIDEVVVFSGFQNKGTRSPALRTYEIGDGLSAMAVLYNAGEASAGSGIEIEFIVYRDGEEYMHGEPMRIAPDEAQNQTGIPVSRNLTMDSALPPGEYVMQLVAAGKRRENGASQALSFTIVDNPPPEQLAAWHIESIGDPAVLSQIKSIASIGTAKIEYISEGFENPGGLAALISEGPKMAVAMRFPDTDSSGEYLAYDGNAVTARNMASGGKSPLADFLYRYDTIMKNGLLGGVYSNAWPLLDIGGSGADMKVRKTVVEGNELYELEYRPWNYNAEMKICLYFDPGTWRHVRTHYYLSPDYDFNAAPDLTEIFDNFLKVGELTLPHSYTLRIEESIIAKWNIEISEWIFNRPDIAPQIFRAEIDEETKTCRSGNVFLDDPAMCDDSAYAVDNYIILPAVLQAVQKNTDFLKENIIDLLGTEEITIEEFNDRGGITREAKIFSEYRIFPEKTALIPDCRVVYEIVESFSSAGMLREERELLSAIENNRTQRLDRYEFNEHLWARGSSYVDLFIVFDKQNENCFDYKLTGFEKNNGRDVYVIHVEQKGSETGLKQTGENENITWKIKYGSSAWIDAETMEVVRLTRDNIDVTYDVRRNPEKLSIFDVFPQVTARYVFSTRYEYEKVAIRDYFLTLPVAKTVELFRPNGKLDASYKYRYGNYKAFAANTKVSFGAVDDE